MSKKWKTQAEKQEFYRRIKEEIRIDDYAYKIGLTPYKSAGSAYIKLREHDSVRIDPNKNCFWRNSRVNPGSLNTRSGSVIDFAIEFTGRSMYDILTEFEEELEGRGMNYMNEKVQREQEDVKEQKVKKALELPPAADNMRNVFAYLTKSRFIEKEVVQEFVDKKMLYQDEQRNCVFVGYDYMEPDSGKPVFACMRGTNTEKRYVRDVDGSDYEKGFFINNHSGSVMITESVIEAMSVMSILMEKGIDHHIYSYLALSGTAKGMPIQTITENCPEIQRYILALNNDEGGKKTMSKYAQYLHKELGVEKTAIKKYVPKIEGFDWNDVLKQSFFHMFLTPEKKQKQENVRQDGKKMERQHERENTPEIEL